jgi:hypothetical protein
MDDNSLKTSFSELLTNISSINGESVQQQLQIIFPDSRDRAEIVSYETMWSDVQTMAGQVQGLLGYIESVPNWRLKLRDCLMDFRRADIFQTEGIPSDCRSWLRSVRYTLDVIISTLSQNRRKKKILQFLLLLISSFLFLGFVNELDRFQDEDARLALDQFIKIGELIQTDSRIDEFQTMVLDTSKFIIQYFKGDRTYDGSMTFIALTVPSMEGKTQSAFTLRKVKPLYFPSCNRQNDEAPQPIYRNYESLFLAIKSYAQDDLLNLTRRPGGQIDRFPSYELDSLFRDFKSVSLGFMCKLVEDASTANIGEMSWMRYHSSRPNFDFMAKSVADIPAHFFDGFCLFLDEFDGEPWCAFLRDLALAARLRCVVANTKSKIDNLVGLGQSSASAPTGLKIWSIVVTSLGRANREILDTEFGLNSSVEALRRAGKTDVFVGQFLDNLINVQLGELRPGVAVLVAETLADLAARHTRRINLKMLLDELMHGLSVRLMDRKKHLTSDLQSFWAKIGLLFEESYNMFRYWYNTGFNGRSSLEYHLYYPANPQNPHSWFFLTRHPARRDQTALNIVPRQMSWTYEFTHFREAELLTILGCLCIPFNRSVSYILAKTQNASFRTDSNISDVPNQEEARRSKNVLEVSAAVSIVDATQHMYAKSPMCSFSGQNGKHFLSNLIGNLRTGQDYEPAEQVNFFTRGQAFNLSKFLTNCTFPFLYSINRPISLLDSLSAPNSSIFVRSFTRNGDSAQIDGHFEFKFGRRLFTCVAECKNRSNKLSANTLQKILAKSLKSHKNVKLSLVFCQSIVTKTTILKSFSLFCSTKKINVYRVVLENNRTFEVIPFSPKLHTDPRLICIVFESSAINP